ncbi:type IV pili methyl-accepting chemotaxis transducer N-terminal domain-containing protein [endosymbiont of Ridgeia piscesae]|jgi:hypothetical protein|uniref:Type IV pili methyl-accepting chemotaxis transducer N-term n=1 Tax=endosymbiont of Ridgeia piscesae TaxID=54398 RepID=A0A0T5YWT9_9GAMM|nr:type IV pili methyl-accepting chemotaxis transducer N-terminal domain-containing protein [endosymbiont of Ridgeia piscesae]KRT55018.1 Type IV pili methyl-accepting chemotaxis transducer N-term [endosymbiont of Ridgeia piscesae]KRT58018.1 Type IV pili methyl-accepting chemotaxis transducer N-term [endosymbiont of Ridgeia piscesae]
MKTHPKLTSSFCLVLLLALPFALHAEETFSVTGLIDRAGMQRMLSQKIAKAYFFLGKRSRPDKARQQMQNSLELFKSNHASLKNKIKDRATQDLLTYIDLAYDEYAELCSQPYTQDNGALVLDLSETLLEVSNEIVKKLEQASKVKTSKIVNLAGRQRMLSQRIAKYYIAYQLGFRDVNSVTQLTKAVDLFEASLHALKVEKSNTKAINTELVRITNLWKVVRGFFLDIKKGGLPVTVFATTDKILQRSDRVTKMYVQVFSTQGSSATSR